MNTNQNEYICDCGWVGKKNSKNRHFKSVKHTKWIKNKIEYTCHYCNNIFTLPLDEEPNMDYEDIVCLSCDYLGKYCGDDCGCVDGECKMCYRCNPILYWSKRRPVTRFDMVLDAVERLKEKRTKYNDLKNCNSYINALNYKLIDTDLNLLIEIDEIMPK